MSTQNKNWMRAVRILAAVLIAAFATMAAGCLERIPATHGPGQEQSP